MKFPFTDAQTVAFLQRTEQRLDPGIIENQTVVSKTDVFMEKDITEDGLIKNVSIEFIMFGERDPYIFRQIEMDQRTEEERIAGNDKIPVKIAESMEGLRIEVRSQELKVSKTIRTDDLDSEVFSPGSCEMMDLRLHHLNDTTATDIILLR